MLKFISSVIIISSVSILALADAGSDERKSDRLHKLDKEIKEQKEVVKRIENAKQVFLKNKDDLALVPHEKAKNEWEGLRITKIKDGSVWQMSGLKKDDVIIKVDEVAVQPYEIEKIFAVTKDSKKHSLTVIRAGKELKRPIENLAE